MKHKDELLSLIDAKQDELSRLIDAKQLEIEYATNNDNGTVEASSFLDELYYELWDLNEKFDQLEGGA